MRKIHTSPTSRRLAATLVMLAVFAGCGSHAESEFSGGVGGSTASSAVSTSGTAEASASGVVGSTSTSSGSGGGSAVSSGSSDTTSAASAGSGGGVPCGDIGQACCADFGCNAGLACDGAQCAPALAPFACAPGSPEAVFVSEVAPPASLAPWATPFASVTFANCGGDTWPKVSADSPAGVKLGGSTPHDLEIWAPSRIALPADVPPGNQITVVVPIHAPPLTGVHPYAFELVREGVAWLGQASPTHLVDIEATPGDMVAVCAGISADRGGGDDATSALQACIDAAPEGGTLALPAGVYRISGVLTVGKAMTLTTAGATGAGASCLEASAPRCAVLRAALDTQPSNAGTRGFVRLGIGPVASVTLDHIVVDGNRGARLGGAAAAACAAGSNGDGINIGAVCNGCTIRGVASARALCGSGLEWDGDGVTIQSSVFWGNGDHGTTNMWSDGLTIHKSDGAIVDHCRFVDNSDVGFISGGGVNAQYTSNYAAQFNQASFAALMLDNFNNGALGDFTNTVLSGNTVICSKACHFGIELGPHPWYASPNIKGGTVEGNTVLGGHIEINAQGAGTAAQPIVIKNNNLGPTPSSAKFLCGTVGNLTPLNVSSDSVVDLAGGVATGQIDVPCP